MKAVYFNEKETINDKHVSEVAKSIKEGKIAVFPTETVYGVGTNAYNEGSCKMIYKIKNRDEAKPLIVLISNYEMLNDIVDEEVELEKKIMENFWPGPLTIVLRKKKDSKIPNIITAGKEYVGIRMTSGKVATELIEKSGVPIVAPSANLSGNPTGKKMKNIINELGDKVDYILDFGDIEEEGKESTVIKIENNKIKILREGKILRKELEKIGKIIE